MRRAKNPFARFSCTKTAICAGAVNHPHHINHMNHSSNKCQRALVHTLIPVNPCIRRTRPALARRDHARGLRQPPVCRNAPKISCPISRELSSISRTRAHTCTTPPSAAKGPPTRPVLARPAPRRARPSPASRLPCCPQNFSHNLTHSLVISRNLSCISPACQPLHPPQKCF